MHVKAALVAVVCAALALGLPARAPAAKPEAADLSALDLIELQIGYTTLLATYYRPITPQSLADGARTGLAGYLFGQGLSDAVLPYVPSRLDRGTAGDYIDGTVVRALLRYGTRVTADGLVQGALAGEAASVRDPYTLLFHPKQFKKFNAYLGGQKFGGIGAVITLENGARARVESTFANGPAERAGVQAGDEITAIDGRAPGTSAEAVAAALRGPAGSSVRLSVVRNGAAPSDRIVVRALLAQPLVVAKMLTATAGYVQLTRFGDDAAAQLRIALAALVTHGARALVFDLRGNGGGYGDEAKKVASAFIAAGPIFTTRERGGAVTVERATGDVGFAGRVAVLVDGDTASAAEIVAGALQDDGRATLVGTKTFGKGVVQSVFPLPDGAALKVTTARYYTPQGRNIDGTGLVPDIVLAEPPGAKRGDAATDPQLARALAAIE